jgi:rubrerythrin
MRVDHGDLLMSSVSPDAPTCLPDGTSYYGRLGEFAYDPDQDKAQCHLCGEWFRWVGGSHLLRRHGWTVANYRQAFGLSNRQSTRATGSRALLRKNAIQRVKDGRIAGPPVTAGRERVAGWRPLAQLRPEMAAEMHRTRNGDLDADTLGVWSTELVWWQCQACGHEWQARIADRVRAAGCPACVRKNLIESVRDRPRGASLAERRPDLAAQLHPTRNGELDPSTLALHSHRRLWWRCSECGHEWQASPVDRCRNTGDCAACSSRRGRIVPPARSLAALHPALAAELHPTCNGELDPWTLGTNSRQVLWWRCRECGHEWQDTPQDRGRRISGGCPRCSPWAHAGSVPRSRSLAALRPAVAEELHPTRNGQLDPWTLGAYSKRTAWWQCKQCGHEWQARVSKRTEGTGCPRCYLQTRRTALTHFAARELSTGRGD